MSSLSRGSSSVLPHEETRTRRAVMVCCDTCVCRECAVDWSKRHKRTPTPTCYACRRPVTLKSLKELEANGDTNSKTFALIFLANSYRNGMFGVEQNFQQALDYYELAAALGSSDALPILAEVYMKGEFYDINVPKSADKASELAEQAFRQSCNASACLLLARFMEDLDMNDRAFHFNSIAAYQGQHTAIYNLGNYYYQKGSRLLKTVAFYPTIELRKALILALYWYGKACKYRNGTALVLL